MTKVVQNQERSFGVSVGLVLVAIAAFSYWRGHVGRAEVVGAIGLVLLTCGLLYPPLLKWPSAAWWRFSRVLGHINARILLTVLFSVLLVPISVVWRIAGNDPLARRRGQSAGWTPYPARYRDRNHYQRMY